jgi:hypothetical protein
MSHSVKSVPRRREAPVVLWAILLGVAFWPRLWIILFWIFDRQIDEAYDGGFIVPFLGLMFMPWTTLMYAWMWSINSSTVAGWEWIFVAIGLASDLFFWIAGLRSLR